MMDANQKPLWMVERHDQDDGSITYEIWDHNPANYRRVLQLNDEFIEEGNHARQDAATIVRSVNSFDGLVDAIRGLIGLCQLVRNERDLPIEAKQALTHNHRIIAAYEALSAAGVEGFQPPDFDAHKAGEPA